MVGGYYNIGNYNKWSEFRRLMSDIECAKLYSPDLKEYVKKSKQA